MPVFVNGIEQVVAHKTRHQDGGVDEVSIAALSGEAADDQPVIDAQVTAVAVARTILDANSILGAVSDNTPVAITLAASRILGRKASGNIAAMTVAELLTLINVAAGADVTGSNAPAGHLASHQDGGGDEISVAALDGLLAADQHVIDAEVTAVAIAKSILNAHTILMSVSDNTPVALTVAASRIVGRKSTGNIVALTAADILTIIGVETGATADLTGTEIVTLLEALGGGSQLSHDQLDDVSTSDHHTKYTDSDAVSAVPVTLAAIVDDLHNNRNLLCLVEGAPETGTLTDGPVPLGMEMEIDGTGGLAKANIDGGAINLTTGSTGDSQSLITTPAGTAPADQNPHFYCRLRSRAATAALTAQGWGLHDFNSVAGFTGTTREKAFFRSVTTGVLFAVTGNSGGEETTDLSSFYTLGTAGVFEVFTTDDGSTWKFHVAGTERASHTTTVPSITERLRPLAGIETNTTTSIALSDIELIVAVQDRT